MLIVISPEKNLNLEIDVLIQLFELGLDYFHLRKPGFNKEQLSEYLDKIPKKYQKRIIIHSHYDLLKDYKLYGIHFTGKTVSSIGDYEGYEGHKSVSCHSFEEILAYADEMDYLFLSPVFDSISKQDYKSSFDADQVNEFMNESELYTGIIALGGIQLNTVEPAFQMGFDGIAVLGAIWQCLENEEDDLQAVNTFKSMKRICSQFALM